MKTLLRAAACFAVMAAISAHAQLLTPIVATGYNFNGIVEGVPTTGGATLAADITASVGTDKLDGIYNYFQQGLDSAHPTDGFVVGTPFISAANANTTFDILPDAAATPNIIIDQSITGPKGGTLTLAAPLAYSSIALLVAGYDNSQTGTYTLNFANGTSQTGTFYAPDNYDSGLASIAAGANERVDVTTDSFANESYNGGPFLYEDDIAVNSTSTLTSITFGGSIPGGSPGGNPGYGIFAVSGSAIAVPEPSINALLALGFASLVFIARRRRNV